MPLDPTGRQPAAGAQAGLDAGHPPRIALVIIAKEVQQAVKSEDSKLGAQRVPRRLGLAAGNPDPDHDIAQPAPLVGPAPPKRRRRDGGKGQDVRGAIFPPELSVERANAPVGNKRDGNAPAGVCGSDACQPPGQAWSPDASHRHDFDIETGPT